MTATGTPPLFSQIPEEQTIPPTTLPIPIYPSNSDYEPSIHLTIV